MKRLLGIGALAFFLAGCDEPQGKAPDSETGTGTASSTSGTASATSVQTKEDCEARRTAFLNRLRTADPKHEVFQRALLNEKNELGVILKKDVDLHQVPGLLRSLLTQMSQEFPGVDLTVIAYSSSEPPTTIGTAQFKVETGEMTYLPAR